MQNTNRNLNQLGTYSTLPKSRSYKKRKTELRLFIEAILMLLIGSNLIIFLNSIPEKFVWEEFTKEAWINLSQGLVQLFEALVKIGTVFSVVFLLLFSLFLLIGSFLRIIKLITCSGNSFRRSSNGKYFNK